jgi:hypothetical protein
MPLAQRTIPANGEERVPVVPVLEAVKVCSGTRGRPSQRLKGMVTEKGSEAKARLADQETSRQTEQKSSRALNFPGSTIA